MPALVKRPPVVAPWPPKTPGLAPTTVRAGEGLAEVAKRAGMTLKQLLLANFNVDMDKQRDWAFFVNFYLGEKLGCKKLTPGGNYIFSGGETIYITGPKVVTLPTPLPSPDEKKRDLGTLVGVREWFSEVILPARTSGPGNLVQNIGRAIQRMRGDDEPNPNGMCGESVAYVITKFREATNGVGWDDKQQPIDGKVMGQVVWNGFDQPIPMVSPNHTAVIICPNVGLKIFNMNLDNTAVRDITPAKGNPGYPYELLKTCRVLDLYAMTDSPLHEWWRKSSWAGYGRITIDTTPDGRFIEG